MFFGFGWVVCLYPSAFLQQFYNLYYLELSKEDLEQIGVDRLSDKSGKKKTSAPVSNNEAASSSSENKPQTSGTAQGDIPDWERELQEELQVFETTSGI